MKEEHQSTAELTDDELDTITDEKLSAIVNAVQSVVNTIYDILKPIIEVAEIALDCINGIWEEFMKTLNPRVQHLALHAKTQRARKKNCKRLQLEFQRYCKEVQNGRK